MTAPHSLPSANLLSAARRPRSLTAVAWLLVTGGFAAGAAGLLAFAASRHWLLDMLSHFRVQFVMVLAVALVGAWFGRIRRPLLPLAALLVVNAAPVAPFYLPAPAACADPGPALRVMTLNLLLTNSDVAAVVDAVAAADPDLLVLAELTPPLAAALADLDARYPHRVDVAQPGHFGIGLWSRLPLSDTAVVNLAGDYFPAIVTTATLAGQPLTVVAAHPVPPFGAPGTALRDGQIARLAELVTARPAPTVLLGDFNATPWSTPLRRLTAATGLRNSALGHGLGPTWRSRVYPLGVAIDHVFVSAEWVVRDRRVGGPVGSDHYPLTVDLALCPTPAAAAPSSRAPAGGPAG